MKKFSHRLPAWSRPGFQPRRPATLDTVKQRGTLVCGVSAGSPGSPRRIRKANYKGLDVDYCRALAAGVLGDAAKVRYVALTAQNRFTALQLGQIRTCSIEIQFHAVPICAGVTLGLRQGPSISMTDRALSCGATAASRTSRA